MHGGSIRKAIEKEVKTMRATRLLFLARLTMTLGLANLLTAIPVQAADSAAPSTPWRISGDLSEACSCSVPCTCNFGEGPSPSHFCWALFSLDIQKGRYGSVKLNGLRLAGAAGEKGIVVYVDDRATPQQADALKAIASRIGERFRELAAAQDPKALEDPATKFLGFKTARIEQEVGNKGHRLMIGSQGGFEGDYILGIDGKTPVVVENNWSWNIKHGIKGKTKRFQYKDEFGNEFDMTATNANQGKFDWSDKTPVYFR
jgi:hypothetical protein